MAHRVFLLKYYFRINFIRINCTAKECIYYPFVVIFNIVLFLLAVTFQLTFSYINWKPVLKKSSAKIYHLH